MENFDLENAKRNLSKGNYEDVINSLLEYTKNTIFHREAIKISSAYHTYKRNYLLNLQFNNEADVQLNRLVEKIYNLILKIERYQPLLIRFYITKKWSNLVSGTLFVGLIFGIYAIHLNNGNFVFDSRDFNVYRTVGKNGYELMIDNLNYDTKDTTSWCYANRHSNCMKYGRLYNWESAKVSCSGLGHGWRLPTRLEIENVIDTLPQKLNVREMLGGGRAEAGDFFLINEAGHLWTNDQSHKEYVWIVYAYGSQELVDWFDSGDQKHGYSCRCIREIR